MLMPSPRILLTGIRIFFSQPRLQRSRRRRSDTSAMASVQLLESRQLLTTLVTAIPEGDGGGPIADRNEAEMSGDVEGVTSDEGNNNGETDFGDGANTGDGSVIVGRSIDFVGGGANNLAPPDTYGSVGLDHYAQFINGRFAVYAKATSASLLAETDAQFWNNAGISSTITNAGLSDPRIHYDSASERWFAVEINVSNTGNQVLVARSETANPAGVWKGLNYTGYSGFADYPTLAVDMNCIMIGTNNFTTKSVGGTFAGVTMTTFPKSDLLLSTPTVANRSTFNQVSTGPSLGYTLQGVTSTTASNHSTIIAVSSTAYGQMNLTHVTGTSGAGAILGATTVKTVATTNSPLKANQPDGTKTISSGDDRISGMAYLVNGLIFTVHSVSLNSAGTPSTAATSRVGIRISVFNDSTKGVVAESNLFSTVYDLIYPSIAVNTYGDMLIGYTRSGGSTSTNGNLGAYASTLKLDFNNPTGGFTLVSSDIVLKAGLANNYHLFNSTNERWGDYSATGVDPSNPTAFWTTQEYTAVGGVYPTAYWGTEIGQVYVAPRVANVTSSAANGAFGIGAVIPITIEFNDNVVVTGVPTLALNTIGGSAGIAYYSTGSGTKTLTFNYTVASANTTGDLGYSTSTSLGLPGGATIKDVASNLNAIVTLASPGATGALDTNKNIVIDAVAPTVLQYRVLFGTKGYNLLGSTRFDLPWMITGIQALFSKSMTSGNSASLTGLTPTGFSGLGTNTLTWAFSPLTLGQFVTNLQGTGSNALKDNLGNPLSSGGFQQSFRVLYGDYNADGVISSADLVGVNNDTIKPYDLFADIDGDGLITSLDVLLVRSRNGRRLV